MIFFFFLHNRLSLSYSAKQSCKILLRTIDTYNIAHHFYYTMQRILKTSDHHFLYFINLLVIALLEANAKSAHAIPKPKARIAIEVDPFEIKALPEGSAERCLLGSFVARAAQPLWKETRVSPDLRKIRGL